MIPLGVTRSAQGFLVELYQEYLAELGMLYNQRIMLIPQADGQNMSWRRVEELEDRMMAFLDALQLGGHLAENVVGQTLQETEDAESLFASLLFAAYQNQPAYLWQALDRIARVEPPDRPAFEQAAAEALILAAPPTWEPLLVAKLKTNAIHLRVLTPVFAAKKWQASDVWIQCLGSGLYPDEAPLVLTALGQAGQAHTKNFILNWAFYHEHPPEITQAAIFALMRLHEPQALGLFRKNLASLWAVYGLGFCGGLPEVRYLLSHPTSPEALFALGLLGDLEALPVLWQALLVPELAPYAAMGLYFMTGAPLWETAQMPEEPTEEESDAEPPLIETFSPLQNQPILGLSTDQTRWADWLKTALPHYQKGLRYRLGLPIHPISLLQCLRNAETPSLVRKCCAEELAIRYGCPSALTTHEFVHIQDQLLAQIEVWATQVGGQFLAGRFR